MKTIEEIREEVHKLKESTWELLKKEVEEDKHSSRIECDFIMVKFWWITETNLAKCTYLKAIETVGCEMYFEMECENGDTSFVEKENIVTNNQIEQLLYLYNAVQTKQISEV